MYLRSIQLGFCIALWIALPGSASSEGRALALSPCLANDTGVVPLCGRIEVPENWDNPASRKISLNVVVVPAITPSGDAPLFDLAGGPGIAAAADPSFYYVDGADYRRTRDVVLVDQRGTGGSSALRCPELENAPPTTPMYPPDAVVRCRDELAKTHDLTQYTTLAAAKDLDAVRAALNAEKVDFYSLSYGTRLAQTYMRAFPDRVRSAVLIGSVPMDMTTPLFHARDAELVLRLVMADCAADPVCSAAYPALESDWEKLGILFDQGPVAVASGSGNIVLERGPFMEAFRTTLVAEAGQRKVPRLIAAASDGDFGPFLEAVGTGGSSPFAEGLYLSVECAEGTNRIRPAQINTATAGTFLRSYRVDRQLGACELWPAAEIAPGVFEPVASDVPTLFISGTRDYVSPTAYAETIASHFTRARVVVVEGMGHYPLMMENIACLDDMFVRFYATPDPAALDTSCVAGMTPPPFDTKD